MHKLVLTFGALLRKAKQMKRLGFEKRARYMYLSGLKNGAENWELPE